MSRCLRSWHEYSLTLLVSFHDPAARRHPVRCQGRTTAQYPTPSQLPAVVVDPRLAAVRRRAGLAGRGSRRPQLLVVEHDLGQRAAREPVVEVLAPADPGRDLGPVCRSRAAVITRRRVPSSAGAAVAGRSAVTPCLRYTVNRGWARRFAYQPRGPGMPVINQRPSTRWNQTSRRRGMPVRAPSVVMSIVRSAAEESGPMARARATASSTVTARSAARRRGPRRRPRFQSAPACGTSPFSPWRRSVSVR